MKRLNLAVVGCGDIAGYMALVSRLVRQVRLSACCDTRPDRAEAFARRHRISQYFTEYTEMLNRAEFDAVYLAVPHNRHYDMILSAVEAGKHVFVEKPVTRTLEEGLKLIERLHNLAEHTVAKVGVHYQYRYDSGCYALARAVQAGELGRIHSIRINIPWHRRQSYFNGAPWHSTIAQAGGGTLITQGSHLLDVALWALGEQPVSAMGYTASPGFEVEVDTLTHGIVETEGSTLISITSSMVAASEQTMTIEVYGERGTGFYRDQPLPRVKFVGVPVRKARPPEWGLHALQRSLAGFANWTLTEKPFLVPVQDALPVLAAVEGIYSSAQTAMRVKISY